MLRREKRITADALNVIVPSAEQKFEERLTLETPAVIRFCVYQK